MKENKKSNVENIEQIENYFQFISALIDIAIAADKVLIDNPTWNGYIKILSYFFDLANQVFEDILQFRKLTTPNMQNLLYQEFAYIFDLLEIARCGGLETNNDIVVQAYFEALKISFNDWYKKYCQWKEKIHLS